MTAQSRNQPKNHFRCDFMIVIDVKIDCARKYEKNNYYRQKKSKQGKQTAHNYFNLLRLIA